MKFQIFQYIILICNIYSIIIPFEVTGINKTNQNYSINSLINDIFYRDIYSILFVGTPPQKVLTLIRPDNNTLFFNKNDCERKKLKFLDIKSLLNENKIFNYKYSSSFKIISTINQNYNNKDYNYLGTDCIYFNNINSINKMNKDKLRADNFHFYLEKQYSTKLCGRLGIGYSKTTEFHIIKQLKKELQLKNYLMIIDFLSDTSGQLIFGNFPHEYENNSIYDSKELITINTGSMGNVFLPWSLSFILSCF